MKKLLLMLGYIGFSMLPVVYFSSCTQLEEQKPEPPIIGPLPDPEPNPTPNPDPTPDPEPVLPAYYSDSITWRSFEGDKDSWNLYSTINDNKEKFERWIEMVPLASGNENIINGSSIATETAEERKTKAEFLWEVLKNNDTVINGSIDTEALMRAIKENVMIVYSEASQASKWKPYKITIKFMNDPKLVHPNTIFAIEDGKKNKILTITLKDF